MMIQANINPVVMRKRIADLIDKYGRKMTFLQNGTERQKALAGEMAKVVKDLWTLMEPEKE